MTKKLDLISFIQSLNEKFINIDFFDARISARITKLYQIIKEYSTQEKINEQLLPSELEFKSISGYCGKILIVCFNKTKIKTDSLVKIIESLNYKIDVSNGNKKITLHI